MCIHVDAGIATCASGCLSANNAVQTACMANAASVEQLADAIRTGIDDLERLLAR